MLAVSVNPLSTMGQLRMYCHVRSGSGRSSRRDVAVRPYDPEAHQIHSYETWESLLGQWRDHEVREGQSQVKRKGVVNIVLPDPLPRPARQVLVFAMEGGCSSSLMLIVLSVFFCTTDTYVKILL